MDAGNVAYEWQGSGAPLLLIHGTGGSRASWAPVAARLRSSRRLLLVDLPGHGLSPPPAAGERHGPAGYGPALARLLDRLELPELDVAGNSVGGWTALELAKLGRARSVVAICPAGLWLRHDPLEAVAQLWAQYRFGTLLAPLMPRLMSNRATRTALLRATLARPRRIPPREALAMFETFVATAEFGRHLADVRRDRFRDGAGLTVPVTVAWGSGDRVLPKRARQLRELPAQTRELWLPACGHVPMWDDPELVASTILAGSSPAAPAPPGRPGARAR